MIEADTRLYTKEELLRELRLQNTQLGTFQGEGMVPTSDQERIGFKIKAVGSYIHYYSAETVETLKIAQQLHHQDNIPIRLMVGLACAPTMPLRYLIPEPLEPKLRARMAKRYDFYNLTQNSED